MVSDEGDYQLEHGDDEEEKRHIHNPWAPEKFPWVVVRRPKVSDVRIVVGIDPKCLVLMEIRQGKSEPEGGEFTAVPNSDRPVTRQPNDEEREQP